MLHVLQNGLLADSLFDLLLGFDVERICIQTLDLPLAR